METQTPTQEKAKGLRTAGLVGFLIGSGFAIASLANTCYTAYQGSQVCQDPDPNDKRVVYPLKGNDEKIVDSYEKNLGLSTKLACTGAVIALPSLFVYVLGRKKE